MALRQVALQSPPAQCELLQRKVCFHMSRKCSSCSSWCCQVFLPWCELVKGFTYQQPSKGWWRQ